MNSTSKKSIVDFLQKYWNQRLITLTSIISIIVLFALLVTYNTINKNDINNDQSVDIKNIQQSDNQTNTPNFSNVKTQDAPPPSEQAASTAPLTQEGKAMADLNTIKIEDKSAVQKKGKITSDGSSNVASITQLVADKYRQFYKNVQVNVGVAGSDAGMQEFTAGNIDICGTTRKITPQELDACKSSGVDFKEYKLAYDAVVIVTNKDNNWTSSTSITELRKIWDSKGRARLWSDVNPVWVHEPLKPFNSNNEPLAMNFVCTALYGNGAAKLSKFNVTVDDTDKLLESVAGDKDAIAFCSYNFYDANRDKLKAIGITTAAGAVVPSFENIKAGSYTPFSRQLYIYVNNNSLQQDFVKAFIKVYIENVSKFVKAGGYIPCEDSDYNNYLNSLN